MAQYWAHINGQNFGFTDAEMLQAIVQQRVMSNTLVSVNGGAWIAANQVPALQQALAAATNWQQQNQPAQNITPQPSTTSRCPSCGGAGLLGRDNYPSRMREWIADRGFGVSS